MPNTFKGSVMERPKYLEYRHRRDQILRYVVTRNTVITLERPAFAMLRLVGKKTSSKRDTFDEEWVVELRTTDVRPDYSALVKIQVASAVRKVKGDSVGYAGMADPTNEFLNETVDRFGLLSEHHGTLPTPHLGVFPEEPQSVGGEWEQARNEFMPLFSPDGRAAGHEALNVVYRGRVDSFGTAESGIEFADLSLSGLGQRGEPETPGSQTLQVTGNIRFALREGRLLSGSWNRSLATYLEENNVLTNTTTEEYRQESAGTEEAVGGMRL